MSSTVDEESERVKKIDGITHVCLIIQTCIRIQLYLSNKISPFLHFAGVCFIYAKYFAKNIKNFVFIIIILPELKRISLYTKVNVKSFTHYTYYFSCNIVLIIKT